MPSTIKVKVEHHALDQCQVFVEGRRVAYVCYGEDKPINWLRPRTSGVELTDEEKVAIAEQIRTQMANLNGQRQATTDKLDQLTKGEKKDG